MFIRISKVNEFFKNVVLESVFFITENCFVITKQKKTSDIQIIKKS